MSTPGSIDIIIPCYQYGRYLRQCVSTVLSQDVADLRVLIIDNASTDDSVEVAQELARSDSRVEVVVHPTNLGLYASYNEGIDWASAEFMLVLDADDGLAPGSLRRAIDIMTREPNVVLTHGRRREWNSDAAFVPPPESAETIWTVKTGRQFISDFCAYPKRFPDANETVRRTEAQKKAGYYRTIQYADVELWLRVAMYGDVAKTNRTQAFRRIHPKQSTTPFLDRPVLDFMENKKAIGTFFANEGRALCDAQRLQDMSSRALEDHAYWSAVTHYVRGYRGEARELLDFANGWRLPPVGLLLKHGGLRHRAQEVLALTSLSRIDKPASRTANRPRVGSS